MKLSLKQTTLVLALIVVLLTTLVSGFTRFASIRGASVHTRNVPLVWSCDSPPVECN